MLGISAVLDGSAALSNSAVLSSAAALNAQLICSAQHRINHMVTQDVAEGEERDSGGDANSADEAAAAADEKGSIRNRKKRSSSAFEGEEGSGRRSSRDAREGKPPRPGRAGSASPAQSMGRGGASPAQSMRRGRQLGGTLSTGAGGRLASPSPLARTTPGFFGSPTAAGAAGGGKGKERRETRASPLARTTPAFFSSPAAAAAEGEAKERRETRASPLARTTPGFFLSPPPLLLRGGRGGRRGGRRALGGQVGSESESVRKGVTPFCLHLTRVGGWAVPPILANRGRSAGTLLRYSLRVSFYHAGSRRFYGNTFQGASVSEEEGGGKVVRNRGGGGGGSRVRRRRGSSGPQRAQRGARRAENNGSDDDDASELDLTTHHSDVAYWYSAYEDPNCLAVVELVATEVDARRGIQLGQYGCGWTFLQMYGPTDPESQTQRDVYRGTPRSLLFFEAADFQRVGESAVPGCTLSYRLQTFDKLLAARHLFRENEIIGAFEPLPGLQVRRLMTSPSGGGGGGGGSGSDGSGDGPRGAHGKRRGAKEDKQAPKEVVGPHLGFELEAGGGRRSGKLRLNSMRLSNLRVVVRNRARYEAQMLASLGDDAPEAEATSAATRPKLRQAQMLASLDGDAPEAEANQKVVRAVTKHKMMGTLSSTKREVVGHGGDGDDLRLRIVVGHGGGGDGDDLRLRIVDRRARVVGHGGGGDGGDLRVRIVDRRVRVGFHNGHALILPDGGRWQEASLQESDDDDDALVLSSDLDSLDLGGFVRHPLVALVVLVEYTLRIRSKEASKAKTPSSTRDGGKDPLAQSSLNVVLGMHAFVPYDGHRLRLRNTPRPEKGDKAQVTDFDATLSADKRVRLVSADLVYTPGEGPLMNDDEGGDDDSRGALPQHAGNAVLFDLKCYDAKGKLVECYDAKGKLVEHAGNAVLFDLKCYDAKGKLVEDETPLRDEDESDIEPKNWRKEAVPDPEVSSSSSSSSSSSTSTEDETSEEEEEEASSSEASNDEPEPVRVQKPTPKRHRPRTPSPKPVKKPQKRPDRSEPALSDRDELQLEDEDKKKPSSEWEDWRHGIRVPGTRDSLLAQSLQAPLHKGDAEPPSLQAPLHKNDAAPPLRHLSSLNFKLEAPRTDYSPTAAVVGGGSGAGAHDLSRASRTRLSRHGYSDVMRDTSHREEAVTLMLPLLSLTPLLLPLPPLLSQPPPPLMLPLPLLSLAQPIAKRVNIGLELSDPLALHELTLQFAGYRCPRAAMSLPAAVHLTYQFYTCAPLRTERLRLLPDAPRGAREGPYRAEEGSHSPCLLVREECYGRDEPAHALKHRVDCSYMQPSEAAHFARYMATKSLFVDVWDADAQLHLGTVAVPLRTLMRQGKAVAKHAGEFEDEYSYMISEAILVPDEYSYIISEAVLVQDEYSYTIVIAPAGAGGDDAAAHGGISIGPGKLAKGAVVGLLQLLACNYGEIGGGGGVAGSGIPSAISRPYGTPNLSDEVLNWRLGVGEAAAGAPPKRRPRHRVRAKPLTETTPELGHYMAAIGALAPARAPSGCQSVTEAVTATDDDSIGYVELMLLYGGRMLALIDVPSVRRLERRLVSGIVRFEKKGGSLEATLGQFCAGHYRDKLADETSTDHAASTLNAAQLEEALRFMGALDELRPEHVKLLLRRVFGSSAGSAPNATHLNIRQFVVWVRARQAHASGAREGSAEAKLLRALARARARGVSTAEFVTALDGDGNGFVTAKELLQLLASDDPLTLDTEALKGLLSSDDPLTLETEALKGLLSSDDPLTLDTEVKSLLKRFDTNGDGCISLAEFAHWAGVDYVPAAALEARIRKTILKAESSGFSVEEAFGDLDADGSGDLSLAELEGGLRGLGVLKGLQASEVAALMKRLDRNGDARVSLKRDAACLAQEFMQEFMRMIGREWRGDASVIEARLKRILLKAEAAGTSVEAAFGALDKDGSGEVTLDELMAALSSMGAVKGLDKAKAQAVLQRFDADGNGKIGLGELMHFLGRPYSGMSAAEAKLRAVLLQAESMGTSIAEAFTAFDKNGDGAITPSELEEGLRALGVFSAVPPKEVTHLLQRFDSGGNGKISLAEFMAFLGREYSPTAVAEAKLKKILLKAEKDGTSLESAFAALDGNRDGVITTKELESAMMTLGVFDAMSKDQAALLLRRFDLDGDGRVSLREFLAFAGRPYTAGDSPLETKLRRVIGKAEAMGTPPDAAFAHFDKDGDGEITRDEFRKGLEEMGVFADFGAEEVDEVLRRFDPSGAGGAINLANFMTFLGKPYTVDVGAKLRKILNKAEELGTTLEDAFKHFDSDGSGVISGDELLRGLQQLGQFHCLTTDEARRFIAQHGDAQQGITKAAFIDFVRERQAEWLVVFEDFEGISKAAFIDFLFTRCPVAGADENKAQQAALKMHLTRVKAPARRRALSSFDGDDDGCLSVAEAPARRRALSSFDGDGDGCLSVAEVEMAIRSLSITSADLPGVAIRSKTAAPKDTADSAPPESLLALQSLAAAAENRGVPLERPFARHIKDVSGRIGVRALYNALEDLGALSVLSREALEDFIEGLPADDDGTVDLVQLLRDLRGGGSYYARDDPEEDLPAEVGYEFSADPDTRDVERKVRRMAGRQLRRGLDIERAFSQYDTDASGTIVRADFVQYDTDASGTIVRADFVQYDMDASGTIVCADFVQAMMELGLSLVDTAGARSCDDGGSGSDALASMRRRQMAQLAKAKGPFERRIMRMRQRHSAFFRDQGDSKEEDGDTPCGAASEALALIGWYREGQKRGLVQSVLRHSLTTQYRIHFSFAQPLFWEHPLRNPFNHEERIRIDLEDPCLRVVTCSREWTRLRRFVEPCLGQVGQGGVEADLFDVDPAQGVQITLMAHEVVYIPFVFLDLTPERGDEDSVQEQIEPTRDSALHSKQAAPTVGNAPDRSLMVTFISASHGHIVSAIQVHAYRRPFPVHRTFRFYQPEGEVLKRSIRLLPSAGWGLLPPSEASGVSGAADDPAEKFVHCVDRTGGNVVVEWRQRQQQASAPAVVGSKGHTSKLSSDPSVSEIFIKYRVGAFPSAGEFYLLLYDDRDRTRLYEIWHVMVHSRLRLDVHATLGQASAADLVVRGDRYSRRVRCFTSAPADCEFDPPSTFQLVSGAYNRVDMRYRPTRTGGSKIQVHMVDVDTQELVGAWLATATALPPVVTKTYELDLPVGKESHKRIAYANPWLQARAFRLRSSDETVMAPRHGGLETVMTPRHGGLESVMAPRHGGLEVAAGGTGFIRLWLHAPDAAGSAEVFLFVNDENDQNEEYNMDMLRNAVEQVSRFVGLLQERLITAVADARRRLLQLLADAEQQLNYLLGEMQRWTAEQQRRHRANLRQPDKRTRAATVAYFDKLPADAAMPPPVPRMPAAQRTAIAAAFATRAAECKAAAAAFAELPGDDAKLQRVNMHKRVRPTRRVVSSHDPRFDNYKLIWIDNGGGQVIGATGEVCMERLKGDRARSQFASYLQIRTREQAQAYEEAPEQPQQHHHRRQSSLVGDAVGMVDGITGAVIGNTTGAVVGGVGAIAGGLCRFVFGGGKKDVNKPETRGRSATRSLSPKGEVERRCESPSD
ncbi:hypothetical protein JKP88DRAFT_349186 [Tribonema minus]|uniref:EF-hand domain-containing protein n=1 Tax=Tribonema minus TaxID=303371 RepID=A0A835YU49_9STRA|nr:hypothetical protein JKP88DRAFT_349186 [Tribonema minus]